MALDPSGDIFVADSGHDRVLEFNSKREYLRQFGSEGSGEGQFKGIGGIATNASGDVYVDRLGQQPRAGVLPDRDLHPQFGSRPGNGSSRADASRSTQSGNVWVLTTHPPWAPARSQEFSSAGAFKSQFGTSGSAGRAVGPGLSAWPSPAGTCMSPNWQPASAGVLDRRHIRQGSSMKQARATANPRCRGASPQTRPRATSTSQKSATTACRSSAPPAASSPPSAPPAPATASSQAHRGSP